MRAFAFLLRASVAFLSAIGFVCASAAQASDWDDWNRFVNRFIQADGRVIDVTFEAKTTSEGQSYALFFALVANQRPLFDTLLKWTSDNLASGQLGDRLPGWLWGARADGSWGLKDRNAAADADLWLAYTLLEAGRLWNEPRYSELGRRVLEQVHRQEIKQAGSAGPVLLPGPYGFELGQGRFRINPSYLPPFMFRYLAQVDARGPWAEVWERYLHMAPTVFSSGVAPDLIVVDSTGQIMADTERAPAGSYDAIRVYLWAGMSGRNGARMVNLLKPYARLVDRIGVPPERVDPRTGVAIKSNYSPLGFSGALLPFLLALDEKAALEKQLQRVRDASVQARRGEKTHYYDQVLILFGKGWLEGRYRFDDEGRLVPAWKR
jgi:endoglucanase